MASTESSNLKIPKTENPLEFDWPYPEEHSEKILELPPLDSFFDFDSITLAYQSKTNSHHIEFQDFQDFNGDIFSSEYNLPSDLYGDIDLLVDQKPPLPNTMVDNASDLSESSMIFQSEYAESSSKNGEEIKMMTTNISGRKKSGVLELDEIQKHFDMPITKAAKEMNVGLTVLKKRCRELNIMRWPHRKMKSLKFLINNVKELGLTNEVVMLEEHKRLLEKLPDMQLTEKTKKLRQACFKANYKKRRSWFVHVN